MVSYAYILTVKDNINFAPSFLCNDNCVKSDYPKHAQKGPDRTACLTGKAALPSGTATVRMLCLRNRRKGHPFCRLQSENGIATLPLPLNAIVAQRGASVGIPHKYYWQRKSGGGDKKSSLLGRQASQTAFRLLLKTGEPAPLLGLQTGYQMSRGKTKKFRSEKKCMLTLTLQDAKPA